MKCWGWGYGDMHMDWRMVSQLAVEGKSQANQPWWQIANKSTSCMSTHSEMAAAFAACSQLPTTLQTVGPLLSLVPVETMSRAQ